MFGLWVLHINYNGLRTARKLVLAGATHCICDSTYYYYHHHHHPHHRRRRRRRRLPLSLLKQQFS
jgi:hypothetical protein